MMKILGIETSCDETAVSVIEGSGGRRRPRFQTLSHQVSSQNDIHAPFGGVVPNLAKREHGRNLIPLLQQALRAARLLKADRGRKTLTITEAVKVRKLLERETTLLDDFLRFLPAIQPPKIHALAVTEGPGLEPALWVGINLAKALSLVWRRPAVPVNHLEGHIVSVLADPATAVKLRFPAVALVVSGGHTELIFIEDWSRYKLLGRTRDDAAGEAFDKVARLLNLPYPGGPQIEELARKAKSGGTKNTRLALPRPMLHSAGLDFSFSGLKTAVLYLVRRLEPLTAIVKAEIAAEFQQAVVEVLVEKTWQAVEKYRPRSVILSGGVAANAALREQLRRKILSGAREITFLSPPPRLTTDNATMIAMAAYLRLQQGDKRRLTVARGGLKLA